MRRSWVVPAMLAGLVAGCGNSGAGPSDALGEGDTAAVRARGQAIPAEEPSIRGVLTVAGTGSLHVETNAAEESGSPKAIVRLMPNARISFRNGEPAGEQDLTVGQTVSVWFEGPVAESYPVQASASRVVIEPAGVPVRP